MVQGKVRDNGQVARLSLGDSQVRVKSQKYSELDIGGRETCLPRI